MGVPPAENIQFKCATAYAQAITQKVIYSELKNIDPNNGLTTDLDRCHVRAYMTKLRAETEFLRKS